MRLCLGSEILGSLTPSTTPYHVRCIFPLLDRLLRRVVEHESYPIDATSIWRIRPCFVNNGVYQTFYLYLFFNV